MGTVTKKHLVDRVASETGLKRTDVQAVVERFLAAFTDELARGNRIEIRDFGVFDVRVRKARTAQNPKTLKRVQVPARPTVRFRPGRAMKLSLQDQPPGQVEVKPTDPARQATSP